MTKLYSIEFYLLRRQLELHSENWALAKLREKTLTINYSIKHILNLLLVSRISSTETNRIYNRTSLSAFGEILYLILKLLKSVRRATCSDSRTGVPGALYQTPLIVRRDPSRRFRSGLAAGQVPTGCSFEACDEGGVAKRPAGALAGADRLQHAAVEPRLQEVPPCNARYVR
jgi:hypothetical protein